MKKTIRDYDLNGKKVIIRCDFNVPIKDGKIVDDNRIVQSLKTIKYAIDNNAKVILFSHLGKVKTEEDKQTKSLEIVSDRLSELLNKKVIFVNETRGKLLEKSVSELNDGDVLLVQNTRFEDYPNKLESGNDEELSKYWASLGELFINDAFATSHRSHASNVGISKFLPSGIGFLVEEEIRNLKVLEHPKKPYIVILGGAKISDKIEIVSSLVKKADKVLIGGGMAYTFLSSKGLNVGKSIVDAENIGFAKKMLDTYGDKIVLPVDSVVTTVFEDTDNKTVVDFDKMNDDSIALDIGPKTIMLFENELKKAETVFWNGTLGYSEYKNFAEGTGQIFQFITSSKATVILGGGDTVAASKVMGYVDKVSYASTGGGAALEFISGKVLPGIEEIDDN